MNEDHTLVDIFRELVKKYPDQVAMQRESASYSNKALWQIAQSVAYALYERGVKKADRIAIVLENRPEWCACYFGILLAGAVVVPLDPAATWQELDSCIEDAGCKIAFTSKQLLPLLSAANRNMELITLDDKMFASQSPTQISIKIAAEDIAVILYNADIGDGSLKAKKLNHTDILVQVESLLQRNILTERDKFIAALPLHQVFSFIATLMLPLLRQSTIIYPSEFENETILSCISNANATVLSGTQQILYLLYKIGKTKIDNKPFISRWLFKCGINFSKNTLLNSNLRLLITNSAESDPKVINALRKFGLVILSDLKI